MDEIRQPLYDTVTLAAAATLAGVRRFFATITEPSGVPKSLMKTNMKEPGKLETATSFRVQGITIDAQNNNAANEPLLPVIIQKSSLSFRAGVKNYWEGPFRFAAGRMLQSVHDTTAATSHVFQQFGWPAIQPVIFQGKHVVELNPLQTFAFTWEINNQDLTAAELALVVAAGTDLLVVGSLKGLLRRPVQ